MIFPSPTFGGSRGTGGPPPFAAQRMIFIALLLGMSMYAVVVAVLLAQQDWVGIGEEPIEVLQTVVVAFGAVTAITAPMIRGVMMRRVEAAAEEQRPGLRFQARLVPVAILEGGVLLALTAWMLNGGLLPYVAVAGVLFAIAVVLVPFTDPDA